MSADADLPRAVRARLAELVAQRDLPADAAGPLGALLALLATDQYAPSAVRDPAAAVEAHVADSLTGLEAPELRAAERIADLGAGAGFPGLPLAVALPAAQVTLVESRRRTCDYLYRAVRAAGLTNVHVVDARAETWTDGMGACDAVIARALAPLPVLLEYAAPLLRPGGAVVAWKGRRDSEEEDAAARAADLLGMGASRVIAVKGGRTSASRHLYVYMKVTDTPPRFPRRPGIATKRPLGAKPPPRQDAAQGASGVPSDRKRR